MKTKLVIDHLEDMSIVFTDHPVLVGSYGLGCVMWTDKKGNHSVHAVTGYELYGPGMYLLLVPSLPDVPRFHRKWLILDLEKNSEMREIIAAWDSCVTACLEGL